MAKRKIVLLISVIITVMLCVGCLPATGKEAYAKMTPEQRRFATEVLQKFRPGCTAKDLEAVLGPPYRSTPGKLYWRRPGADMTERVDVYFLDGKVRKIRYGSLSPFWIWDLSAEGDKFVPRE